MDASTRTKTTGDASLPAHLLLTAEQAAASLAICRTKLYELLRNGQLESIRIGTSRRIPTSALAEYVERIREERAELSDAEEELRAAQRHLDHLQRHLRSQAS